MLSRLQWLQAGMDKVTNCGGYDVLVAVDPDLVVLVQLGAMSRSFASPALA